MSIEGETFEGLPVTICPPGKRSKLVAERERPESSIPVITQTALASPVRPSLVPPAHNDRRSIQERVEAALRADAQSVALAQPHRQGQDDRLAGSALGRYCLRRWPGEARRGFREDRCEAGNRYAIAMDNDKIARGFAPRTYGAAAGGDPMTEKTRDLYLKQFAEAASAIRDIPRAVTVMERLCWEDRDCGPYDEDVAFHALYRLAKHFGIEKRGVHDSKD